MDDRRRPKITITQHARERMDERAISVDDILGVLESGEIVEAYSGCQLILGWRDKRPIHVVAADSLDGSEVFVITVYEPAPARWSADFKKRL